jgi:methylated-DNA-[protein]-cysteine S-methyltransferase
VSRFTVIESPLGELLVTGDDEGRVTSLWIGEGAPEPAGVRDDAAFAAVRAALDAYFAGDPAALDAVPLAPTGTPFQRLVWDALRTIPHGQTRTYGQIADQIGRPSASRAVGAANGRNPIAILVPCHRVVGADGTLTGYAGGLERKRALLALERGALF